MINPFELIEARLQRMETLIENLGQTPPPATTSVPADELFTVEQAAAFLHLKKPTIYGLVSRRELPAMKRTKRLMFSKQDLCGYLQKGRRKTMDELAAEAANISRNRTKKGSHE